MFVRKSSVVVMIITAVITLGSTIYAAEPDVIRLPTPSDLTGVSVYYIAEALGLTKEVNIKFEYVGVVASGQLVASVVAGKIDVGGAHVNRTIAGINAGAKIKCVVGATETTKEKPHMTFITLQNSPILSPKDIYSKRVGLSAFGGCNEYTTYAYLLQKGTEKPKGTFENVIVPASKLEQTLRQGEIDIAGLHDNPDNIISRGGLKILYTDFDIWKDIGGATPAYFSVKFIKEKPDVVRRFVKIVSKTNNFINAFPDSAIKLTAQRAEIDPSKLRANFYTPDGIIKESTVQVWIDLLEKFNEIKPGIKAQDVYTNEFNDFLTHPSTPVASANVPKAGTKVTTPGKVVKNGNKL